MKLQNVLEKFKQEGNYSIALFYGDNVGSDDLDVPQNKRNITIIMSPMGYLGEIKKLVVTNLDELENFDFNQIPKEISNPPQYDEYEDNGIYIWGIESSVRQYINKINNDL